MRKTLIDRTIDALEADKIAILNRANAEAAALQSAIDKLRTARAKTRKPKAATPRKLEAFHSSAVSLD